MKKENISIIQKISLDILNDIVDVCERNGIKYVLLYGTLLGAVRHKGIIPWDDDIDIGMTRENYMKFIEIAESELCDKDKVFVMGSGHKYLSEIKIGRNGTKYCLNVAEDLKIMDQICVDIFLIDYIKPHSDRWFMIFDPIKRFLEYVKLDWEEKKLLMRCIDLSKHKFKFIYKFALFLFHGLRCILSEKGIEWLLYKLYVDKTNSSPYFGVILSDTKVRKMPSDFEIIKLLFEEGFYSAPSCYDKILSDMYGNYMELPPESKRYRKNIEDWTLIVNNKIL